MSELSKPSEAGAVARGVALDAPESGREEGAAAARSRAPVRSASFWQRAVDPAIFCALFGGYLAALLATAHTLGYARDEGFYFHAAGTYGRWFEQLLSEPSRALTPSVIDRSWRENREHPALMKSLFWLSQYTLEGRWFSERGTALRFPAMVISSLGVATTFAFGRRCAGRGAGVVAALAFALMPRVFYHSHLACFDMPIASFWLFVAYAYYRSTAPRGWPWAIACGVLYGLALETKHNAWYLPPALVAHAVALGAPGVVRRLRERRRAARASRPPLLRGFGRWLSRGPLAVALMLTIGPLVFYALWPWIWRDTWARLAWYFEFHWQHVYYNMEFLGRTYFEPPFPRSYAPLMTLATVPLVTLVLALVGGVAALGAIARGLRAGAAPRDAAGQAPEGRSAEAGSPAVARPEHDAGPERAAPNPEPLASSVPPVGGAFALAPAPADGWSFGVLWAACLVLSYAPWLLSTTPIFGGTKHWLNAYPFLSLFAGAGFAVLQRLAREALPGSRALGRAAPWLLGACTMIGPLVMTWRSHPWGLSAYTPIVGGAPGAATLGLNRTFWGYTTGAVVDYLNGAPRGARVFLHDTAFDSFRMLQKDRRLRGDLRPWGTVSGSSVALYHHEQHMSRVEHMIWVDYGTTAPSHVGTFDGVPVVWVYQRPGSERREAGARER